MTCMKKAPSNIHISYPLSNGVIADIHNMEKIVRFFLNDLTGNSIKSADYYIAVPTDVTEVEKRAFYDLIRDANVKAKEDHGSGKGSGRWPGARY